MEDADLTLVSELYRSTNALTRELDSRLLKQHDITFIQAVTLMAIRSFECPQPHLVAGHLGQQSQTVTGVLDRLERAGLVERRRDLGDRRAVRLELSGSGRQLVDRVSDELQKHLKELLDGLDGGARAHLGQALDELERTLRNSSEVTAPVGV